MIYFSIIIPTYNRAQFISETIKSVIAQEFTNWELIIIDDGSKDNTKEIISQFQKRDARIKYYYQKNTERSAARNNGILYATGKYICFLDSDDLYSPLHLKYAYEEIIKNGEPTALFFTNVTRKQEEKLTPILDKSIEEFNNPVCYILLTNESVIPARVIISSNILSSEKFNQELTVSEDAELFSRIAAKYPVIQIKHNTVIYNIHKGNETNILNNPFVKQLVSLKIIFRNTDVKPMVPCWVKNKKLSSCYFGIAQYHELKGSFLKMTYYLIISILYRPFDKSTKRKIYLIFANTLRLKR